MELSHGSFGGAHRCPGDRVGYRCRGGGHSRTGLGGYPRLKLRERDRKPARFPIACPGGGQGAQWPGDSCWRPSRSGTCSWSRCPTSGYGAHCRPGHAVGPHRHIADGPGWHPSGAAHSAVCGECCSPEPHPPGASRCHRPVGSAERRFGIGGGATSSVGGRSVVRCHSPDSARRSDGYGHQLVSPRRPTSDASCFGR